MLRPELYSRLSSRFGKVTISSEGEEMQATPYLNGITGKAELRIASPGEYFVVSCPYCNDTRQRLWINHRWGYHDPQTGGLNLWLAHCFNEDCLDSYERQRALYNLLFDPTRPPSNDRLVPGTRQIDPSRPAEAPGIVVPLDRLPPGHDAVSYLQDRGFDPNQLSRDLGVGVCVDPNPDCRIALGRIIIPVRMGGKLMGWQGRYVGEPPSPEIPKYYTMRGMRKTQLLYNLDVAKRYPFVTVCEGVTDVWRAGPTAVALFGKSISETQKQLLAENWRDGVVIVMLDSDAAPEALRIHAELAGLVRHRVVVELPDGTDPASLDRQDLDQIVIGAARQQGVDLVAMLKESGSAPMPAPPVNSPVLSGQPIQR